MLVLAAFAVALGKVPAADPDAVAGVRLHIDRFARLCTLIAAGLLAGFAADAGAADAGAADAKALGPHRILLGVAAPLLAIVLLLWPTTRARTQAAAAAVWVYALVVVSMTVEQLQ